uniref:Serine and arginine rich splicing factor 7 n=1 Tax=Ursus maritimus TaxID=29073 RepID=A0A452UCE6_URSMA
MRRVQERGEGRGRDTAGKSTGLQARSSVPMETYSSARSQCLAFSVPSAPLLHCFRPAPLCRAERRNDACAGRRSRRIYKREPRLFLVVPSGPLATDRVLQLLYYTLPGHCELRTPSSRASHHVALRAVWRRVICGSRVRVELSTGMPRRSRFDRPPARRPFDPNDRCYECGEKGHYAYDCHRYSRRRRSRSRSRSHSRSRGRRYSRSRSRSRGRRSRSASPRRSRSVSLRRSRSASLRRSRSGSIKGSRYFQSRSRSRSRSRSLSRPRSSRSKSRSPSPKRSRSPSGSPRRSASPERVD